MSDYSMRLLRDLLAVVHRDGGHRTYDRGLEASHREAVTEVLRLRAENEQLAATIRAMKEKRDE